MMRSSVFALIGIAIAGTTLAGCEGSSTELKEISASQQKIIEKLDEQNKSLKDLLARAQGGGRPQIDPNKVYTIDVSKQDFRGPKDAPVTLVEFSDFQCPFCAQTTPLIEQVLQAYPKEVRFAYMQFPLEQIHPQAMPASKAVIAARNQGKFWPMHDELFKISKTLSAAEIRKKAEAIGLDLKKFDADMAAPETEKLVREELAIGRSADVSGTPTLFINGKRVTNRSVDGMKAMVDEALKKKS